MQEVVIASSVAKAAKENQSESLLDLIYQLDRADHLLRKNLVDQEVFDWMLRALEVCKKEGNECGFHIFGWFLDKFPRLTNEQRETLGNFVATNYGQYSFPPVVILMAEWVGSESPNWSIVVLESWLKRPMHPTALLHLHLAIDEVQLLESQLDSQQREALARIKSTYDELRTAGTS